MSDGGDDINEDMVYDVVQTKPHKHHKFREALQDDIGKYKIMWYILGAIFVICVLGAYVVSIVLSAMYIHKNKDSDISRFVCAPILVYGSVGVLIFGIIAYMGYRVHDIHCKACG